MRPAIPLLALACCAAGCMPAAQWTRPGSTHFDTAQDLVQCRDAAWRAALWNQWAQLPSGDKERFGERFAEEAWLAQSCMLSKGYVDSLR